MAKKMKVCAFCGIDFYTANSKTRFCSQSCAGKNNRKDITNQTFGKLIARKRLEEKNASHGLWLCECECGNFTKVPINFLTGNHTTSCGCARNEKGKWKPEKHPEHFQGTNISRIANPTPFKSNTSGVRGVHKHVDGRWIARIGFQGQRINLGIFDKKEDAIQARHEAEKEFYAPIINEYYSWCKK